MGSGRKPRMGAVQTGTVQRGTDTHPPMWFLALLLSFACVADSTDDRRAEVLEAVARYAEPLELAWDSTATRVAWVDLNGDGRDDALVYMDGPEWCGSGGCTLLAFEAMDEIDAVEMGAYRPAAEISLVHGPVLVAKGRNGWSDLIVESDRGELRVLRFDGETYPLSPADGARLVGAKPPGTVAFAAD